MSDQRDEIDDVDRDEADEGDADAAGSPRARRQAKLVAWLLILVFVAPIVGGLLYTALS